MGFSLSTVIAHLPDSIVQLVARPVVTGIVVDDLTQCNLPARNNLGVVFRHRSLGAEPVANNEQSEAPFVEIRYVDGEQRGTVKVTEQQAHAMQQDFRKQVARDHIVNELKLPARPD